MRRRPEYPRTIIPAVDPVIDVGIAARTPRSVAMAIARPGGSPRICLWTRYTGMQTAKKLSGIVTIHINTAQSASNQRLSIAMRSAADRG